MDPINSMLTLADTVPANDRQYCLQHLTSCGTGTDTHQPVPVRMWRYERVVFIGWGFFTLIFTVGTHSHNHSKLQTARSRHFHSRNLYSDRRPGAYDGAYGMKAERNIFRMRRKSEDVEIPTKATGQNGSCRS